MRIRRSEETFHLDGRVDLFNKADELSPVHLFADVFV
jgi:hypothetical protein